MAHNPIGYQTRILNEAKQSLGLNRNVLIEAPTGAGKSGLASLLAWHWVETTGEPALILEDSLAIFQQMAGFTPTGAKTVSEVEQWIGRRPGSIGDATYGGNQQNGAPVVVGMVDTIQSWIESGRAKELQKYSLVLIDEAHHTYNHEDSQYRAVLKHLETELKKINPDAEIRVVGASATPWRPENEVRPGYNQLDPAFLANCDHHKIHFMEVQATGRVVMPKTFVPDVRNEHGISAHSAYRDIRDLPQDHAKAMEEIAGRLDKIRTGAWWVNAVQESVKIAGGDSVLWYTDDLVNDAKALTTAMDALGVRYEQVDAGTSKQDKARHLADFEAGKLKHLVSCGTLIEGFNASIAKTAVNARKCTTKRFQQQIGGRIVRKHDGYEIGKFVDLGATSWLHGKIEDRYQHEYAVESTTATAAAILTSMTQIGKGWSLQSDGASNVYARVKGDMIEIVESAPKKVNGKGDASIGRPVAVTAAAFVEKMQGLDPRYQLGSAAAPATSRGTAKGYRSAWQEHVSERAYSGAELDQFFTPQAAQTAGKVVQMPVRRRLVPVPVDGLKGVMEALHPRAVEMAQILSTAGFNQAAALQAGASVLEAFVEIGNHLPRGGKLKDVRVDIQIAQSSAAARPMGFVELQAGILAASKALGHDEVRAAATNASCGALRARTKEAIDSVMMAIHTAAVAAQKSFAAPAARAGR